MPEVQLPENIRASIEEIIKYNWDAELEDARTFLDENGSVEGHVFQHLVDVDNWLNDMSHTAEEYLTDDPPEEEEEDA